MFGKSLVIFVVLGTAFAQQLSTTQQSDNFRESVAKAIRENVARLRSRGNTQVIDFPGTGNTVTTTITNDGSFVAQSEVPAPRPTPSLIVPIVHLPLPVLRQPEPLVRRPESVVVRQPEPAPIVVEDNRINNDEDAQTFSADEEEQAKNAHYSFDSSVQDTINGHSHTRQETRDGLALKGMYSYSDGFFKRTVHYAADEGGYRVTKEEIEPIGDGPQFNPSGKADVSTSLTGSYSITAEDFKRPLPTDVQQ